MGMQSEIHWLGIGTHGNAFLRSIGREIGTKASDLRINTRFKASPKAFILYGLLKTHRPY